jgi:hypothetical protein
MKQALVIICLLLVLAGCFGSQPSCAEQSKEFATQTNELMREWEDAILLASNTPRMQLPDQIEKLQALNRRAEDLPAPDCALPIRAVLTDATGVATRSMVDFMTQSSMEFLAGYGLDSSQKDLDIVRHALTAMADYKGSWQPLMVDDVKKALSQYTWRDETYPSGLTAIIAGPDPVTIEVLHKNGVVYIIKLDSLTFDNPNPTAAWEIIAPTASTLLPSWGERDSWLAEFRANMPSGSLSETEHADVTTLTAEYSAVSGVAHMEGIHLRIYFPHK